MIIILAKRSSTLIESNNPSDGNSHVISQRTPGIGPLRNLSTLCFQIANPVGQASQIGRAGVSLVWETEGPGLIPGPVEEDSLKLEPRELGLSVV